ncbi:hypothetical protein Ahy_B08g090244 isoform A [Arachis hypogaea]|uniref:Uncharacterized protein n=1 Tax=Arachis hypogaea TaxID=3818 RepID=A0A444XZS5_ARAHY|nr:hypothetical protein Ahy_B08g090244 isoform A [Arachis hypogaea]
MFASCAILHLSGLIIDLDMFIKELEIENGIGLEFGDVLNCRKTQFQRFVNHLSLWCEQKILRWFLATIGITAANQIIDFATTVKLPLFPLVKSASHKLTLNSRCKVALSRIPPDVALEKEENKRLRKKLQFTIHSLFSIKRLEATQVGTILKEPEERVDKADKLTSEIENLIQ